MPSYTVTNDVDPNNQGNAPGSGPLRVGGKDLAKQPVPPTEANRPDTLCNAAKKQAPALEVVRDTTLGTERIREKGEKYLLRGPGELPANYQVRLKRSVFFNVFGRTIDGLVGQVFKKDPKLGDDVPVQIRGDENGKGGHWENIDNAGTHGDVFLRDLLTDALAAGHAAILVDYPNTGGKRLTLADEKGLRPYWVAIKKENILSWRTAVIGGKTVLTQVVLKECQYVADGDFGEKEQTQYRVLYRTPTGVVGFSLLEIQEDKTVIEVDFGLYGNQQEIPLAEITTSGTKGIFESDPPLLDLAFLNIAHYQQWSDYATSINMTCVPFLFTAGVTIEDDKGNKVVVGPHSMISSMDPAAKAEYVSHDGQALGSCKESLDDLVANMGTLGIAMLAPDKRQAETATAHRQDKSTEESSLAVTARGLEDGAERALYFHAKYLKLDDGGSIDINREFEEQTMQADMLTAWSNATASGLPARLQIEAMQTGGLISPEEDVEEIALEMEAAAQAKADAEQQALQDQIAMKQTGKPSGMKIEYGENGRPSRLSPDKAA